MHILKERRTKKNKLEKRVALRILVRNEGTYIYRIYVLTKRREKIVKTSNVRFNERKGLIINREEKKELIFINQNLLNKKQYNAEERILTTLNSLKILKLDINK